MTGDLQAHPDGGGRHRWDKGGPVDHLGRRTITDPVPADYWPHRRTRPADAVTAVIPAVPDNRSHAEPPPTWPGPTTPTNTTREEQQA